MYLCCNWAYNATWKGHVETNLLQSFAFTQCTHKRSLQLMIPKAGSTQVTWTVVMMTSHLNVITTNTHHVQERKKKNHILSCIHLIECNDEEKDHIYPKLYTCMTWPPDPKENSPVIGVYNIEVTFSRQSVFDKVYDTILHACLW